MHETHEMIFYNLIFRDFRVFRDYNSKIHEWALELSINKSATDEVGSWLDVGSVQKGFFGSITSSTRPRGFALRLIRQIRERTDLRKH